LRVISPLLLFVGFELLVKVDITKVQAFFWNLGQRKILGLLVVLSVKTGSL